MALPQLRAGVYRHYKGHHYLVLGYGHDANDEHRITVHYVGLELIDAHAGPRLATRTAESDDPDVDAFGDLVHIDGTKCLEWDCERKHCPRFQYVGPTWAPVPADTAGEA